MINNKEIGNKDDFVTFVHQLSKNFRDDPKSWQNNKIDSFLEALASWVNDMEGYYINKGMKMPDNIDWQVFANTLLAAKIYE